MKKIIITALVIIGSLAGIFYILNKNKEKNKDKTNIVATKNATVSVRTTSVKTESISLDFTANGNFEPSQELNFSAEKPGRVVSVLVDEGANVRVGQTLAIVRADQINVEVETADANYQNAKTDYNRFENAFSTGGVTKQQLDQAKLNLVNAESRLKQSKINIGDTNIKATINGIVNKRYIEPGSVLSAGTQLFEIVNVSKLKFKTTVNENQVSNLKTGSLVTVKASVYEDKSFSGKITFIAPKSDSSLSFPIEIEIQNNNANELKAGMYGTAYFDSGKGKEMMTIVPRTAFIGSVNSNKVFVVRGDESKIVDVKAGRIIGDQVEILSGLTTNDVVILTGQINLQDGTKIEIIK